MTTKLERLRSALPQADHDETGSHTPDRSFVLGDQHARQDAPSSLLLPSSSPQAQAGTAHIPAGAVYTTQPLDREKQLEVLTIGKLHLEMQGGLRQALANHRDHRCQQFFDYWLALANERQALPSRQTIDPLQMPRRLISNLFMTEVVYETGNQARYRFRLLGQEITDREDIRPGDYVHELGGKHGAESLEPHYRDCLQGRIWLRHSDLTWSDPHKSFIHYDVLVLPLARDGRDVDSMIGIAIYDN
jgi:hypothetical protein